MIEFFKKKLVSSDKRLINLNFKEEYLKKLITPSSFS